MHCSDALKSHRPGPSLPWRQKMVIRVKNVYTLAVTPTSPACLGSTEMEFWVVAN